MESRVCICRHVAAVHQTGREYAQLLRSSRKPRHVDSRIADVRFRRVIRFECLVQISGQSYVEGIHFECIDVIVGADNVGVILSFRVGLHNEHALHAVHRVEEGDRFARKVRNQPRLHCRRRVHYIARELGQRNGLVGIRHVLDRLLPLVRLADVKPTHKRSRARYGKCKQQHQASCQRHRNLSERPLSLRLGFVFYYNQFVGIFHVSLSVHRKQELLVKAADRFSQQFLIFHTMNPSFFRNSRSFPRSRKSILLAFDSLIPL